MGRAARGNAALRALVELPEQRCSRRTCTLHTSSLPRGKCSSRSQAYSICFPCFS